MPAILGAKNKTENKTNKGASAWLLPTLTVAGAVLILAASVLTYVMVGYSFIYPEVYSDGVKLGGQTPDGAARVMLAHVGDKLRDSRLVVTAGGVSEEFTPDNTGALYMAGETANDAYAVGRTGGFFNRLGQLYRAYFGRVDVPVNPGMEIDETPVRERVARIAGLIDKPAVEFRYEIRAGDVTVYNASEGARLDQEAIVAGVMRAFGSLDFTPLNFEPDALPYAPFDFAALRERVYVERRDAYMDAGTQDNAVLIPHVTGVDIDLAALESGIRDGAPSVTVPFIRTEPDIDLYTLQRLLFRDELSSYTTLLSASNIPRTANIRLAAEFVNGVTLAPGDVFSYNDRVGKRTSERGFQEAGAYLNGRLVEEIGGGICQLSSTMYNTALLANLSILERSCHSMTVSYVPTGRDAMVNWGTQDLRFENSTNYPIRIMAEQAENYVTVTIVGTKENNHSVFIERVQVSHTPAEAIEQVNPELPPGKSMVVQDAYDGWTVETYRVVLDGEGNEISRIREAVSRYRKVDKITEVGPPAPPPEPPPTPEPPPPNPEPPPEPPDSEPPSDGPVEDTPGPPDAEPMPQPGPMPADPDGDGGDGEPIAPPIGEL